MLTFPRYFFRLIGSFWHGQYPFRIITLSVAEPLELEPQLELEQEC
jgi:hypothetical protein